MPLKMPATRKNHLTHMGSESYARRLLHKTKTHAVLMEYRSHRLFVVMLMFGLVFLMIAGRLYVATVLAGPDPVRKQGNNLQSGVPLRADIVDRHGVLLASNLSSPSVYANPTNVLDPAASARQLHEIFPELSYEHLLEELTSKKSFVWIKRSITPKEQHLVNSLGVPGISFQHGQKRVYLSGPLMAHVLGYVSVDGSGLAGIEKQYEDTLTAHMRDPSYPADQPPEPLRLSVDLRIQNILYEEIQHGIDTYRAAGGTGIVMDTRNGEILGMISLPNFDPHNPGKATENQLFNRATLAIHESGSVYKTFTMAMALDCKAIKLNDRYDVSAPIRVAKYSITDFRGKGGWLTVPEIFMYSSNIGMAKIALDLGKKRQQKYMRDFGLMSPLEIEIPEKAIPSFPKERDWSDVSAMTISYGYGMAVSPMHMVAAYNAVVNGGTLYKPTLIKHSGEERIEGRTVLRQETSLQMRKLLRLAVAQGTARKAGADGYIVGGKTGTAYKSSRGGYNEQERISSFIGTFPMNDPQFVVMVLLDNPHPTAATYGYATGGWTSAPIAGKVIERVGTILGIQPVDEQSPGIQQQLWINFRAPEAEKNAAL